MFQLLGIFWDFLACRYIWIKPNQMFYLKACLRAYVDSEGPDQPVHSRNLIRPSLLANRFIEYYRIYEWRAKARMILCACAGWCECAFCVYSKGRFRLTWPMSWNTTLELRCLNVGQSDSSFVQEYVDTLTPNLLTITAAIQEFKTNIQQPINQGTYLQRTN